MEANTQIFVQPTSVRKRKNPPSKLYQVTLDRDCDHVFLKREKPNKKEKHRLTPAEVQNFLVY